MSAFIARILACKLLVKIGKAILIAFLTELSKRTDNTIDDVIVKSVTEALE